MDKTLIVHGYHGTSQTKAANILKYGFLASDNDYDWLGTGIYFFQIFDLAHVQIAIRNPTLIKTIELIETSGVIKNA
jgi:hypothetical protein